MQTRGPEASQLAMITKIRECEILRLSNYSGKQDGAEKSNELAPCDVLGRLPTALLRVCGISIGASRLTGKQT